MNFSQEYAVYRKTLEEATNTEVSDVGLSSSQTCFAMQGMVLHPFSLMSSFL